jgi:hypothetical protein
MWRARRRAAAPPPPPPRARACRRAHARSKQHAIIMMMVGGLAVVLYFAGLCQRGVATLAVPTSIALHDASARSTADGALLGGGGFVSGWLQAITAGSEVPVAVQLCSLQPPMKPQPRPPTNCDIGGKWTYCDAPYVYIFVPSSPGNQRGPFTVNSNKTSDPWHEANGEYLSPNSTAVSSPARCAGGLVPHRAGSGSWDIDIHFNCVKGSQPHIESHKGRFSPDCNSLTMDDGGSYKRVGTHPTMGADTDTDSNTEAGWQREDSGCSVAQLIPVRHDDARDDMWVPAAQPGWTQTVKQYMLADRSLQFDVAISTDNAKSVVRVQSNVTALKHLTRCVGGVALLNLTIQHTASTPTTLYGSTGGPAGASTALQPWQCPLGSRGKNMTCQHVAGTPFRPHEDLTTTPLIATVDSGIDGRSSNFQLAIHSVAMGSVAAAQHGVWMAPEYSGLWRQDTWQLADATRFYWYLPSLLTSMNEGQTIELPAAAFGEWSANGGASDWSNAVRKVISQHFTPLANRVTKQRPWAKATYQGLGALPSYQTEDVLYQTVANAQLLELEQWTWDAGTYTWCKPSSQCNGTAVVEGRCCDSQGDWFAQQGDYMPQDTRFPEHGFMALQRSVGQAVGSTGGRANMGVWITPQASFNDKRTFQNNKRLYLAGGGPGAPPSTNNLLNLSDPRAQDLFFHQFQTLILQYNCSRIWFDYNTASRQTHWNLWEAEDAQGLLELGFYRGLYNVFDRTLATFPTVWIEGCASGGRMIDLGSLSRTMSQYECPGCVLLHVMSCADTGPVLF